jgi:C-5 cytosine-specific DNA methylase
VRILDLFCCAGGATRGYKLAFPGAHIVGVDIASQSRYIGDEFIQADAMTFPLDGFDLIHASPPCQRYSDLAKRNRNGDKWPDYIPALRDWFHRNSITYVIENVEGAPLHDPVMLCGTMFPGLRVLRHRLFESSFAVTAPPHGRHPLVFTHDKRKAHYGTLDQDTAFVQVTGGGNARVANKGAAMGVDWMTGAELNEAIPPAYTQHIGEQFALTLEAAA